MPGNDKQSQQKRPTGTKKNDSTTFTDVDERESNSIPEDDLYAEDDPPTVDTPRNHTSAIRFNNPTGSRRRDNLSVQTTPPQNIPVPSRRSGQPTTPSPNVTQARPMRNTTIHQPSWTSPSSASAAASKHQRNMHWLLYVGVGMIAALALFVVASSALAWAKARYDDITYGNPRTFQIDAVVGHGGDSRAQPSHFIAVNLHGQVIIVELMAGNPAKSINYTGPDLFEQGGDLIPVTLEFRDVTEDGKLDMLVHIQDKVFVFVNDGTKFRPSNGSDKIHL